MRQHCIVLYSKDPKIEIIADHFVNGFKSISTIVPYI